MAISALLTTTEAAVAAGVSVRDVNRAVDERILPETLYDTSKLRTFHQDACLLIAFYFSTADSLTAEARLRMIRNKLVHSPTWEQWSNWSIEDGLLTVHFDRLWESVDRRLRELTAAKQLVVQNPRILSGTAVIRGTRVPVHDVASQVNAGTPTSRILDMYPSLTAEQVELAKVYAESMPLRGRPRRLVPPKGSKILRQETHPRKVSAGGR